MKGFGPWLSETDVRSSGKCHHCLNDTSSRKSTLKRTKGQPEGSAVTGKAGKPGVAEKGLVSNDAAGQNNSNLTS